MLPTFPRYLTKLQIGYLLNLFRTSVFASVLATFLLTTASAQISETSAQAVKETVQAQLAAFAADDAIRAFSYAAPTIRDMFQTPDNFMAMVQRAYPVVYRPANVLFLSAKGLDSSAMQPVRMWDKEGNSWLATYQLERQADGPWLINACMLVRDRTVIDLTLAD
jgi:hypothetical protein